MTDEKSNTPVQTPQPQPLLEKLSQLIGTWDATLVFPINPPGTIEAPATFEWLEGGAFVIERVGGSAWIIGPDDTNDNYSVLYHDDRGVSRVYQMSLENGLWKMLRIAPGFSQRFEGKFSADGKTITAHWEISTDDTTWKHDFDLTYIKR